MWSKNELKWLALNYPAVKSVSNSVLAGPLVFRMLFRDGNRYINPSDKLLAEGFGTFIAGVYHIRIEHQEKGAFPKSFETGGKIQEIATAKGLEMIDLHTFPIDGSLCLASPMITQSTAVRNISLKDYMEDFLIPYLFAQRYFAKNNKWPWGDLSHGIVGHFEWLGRIAHPELRDAHIATAQIKVLAKDHFEDFFAVRPRMHHPCMCGSGKKFRGCHPAAKVGLTEIRKFIYSGKIDLSDYKLL
jgi:hypothetical protein